MRATVPLDRPCHDHRTGVWVASDLAYLMLWMDDACAQYACKGARTALSKFPQVLTVLTGMAHPRVRV